MKPRGASQQRKVSQIIADLAREPKERVKLADLLAVLDERAFGVLMLILSLPNAVGLGTIPGLSTVFGVPQIVISLQMIVGARRPWLPGFVLERSIAMKDFRTMVAKADPYLTRLERLLQPRLVVMSTRLAEGLLGVVLLLLSVAVALPIPFANQPPAVAQALIALGVIERDGAAVIVGVAAAAVAIGIALLVGGGIIAGIYFAARAVLGL